MKKILMLSIVMFNLLSDGRTITPCDKQKPQAKTSWCQKITNLPMDVSDLLYYRIREVDEGKFYRSAQLPQQKLEECIQKFGIKTIINLRTMPHGKTPQWWLDEQAVAQACHVTLVNIPMNTEVLPPKETLETLLAIYKNPNNFPILVHCAHGIHRTGLASFLYLALIGDKNAARQLSFKYFYSSLWGSEAFDTFVKDIWLQSQCSLENYHPEIYPKFDPAQHGIADKSD
ncbi:MAG: tyrosine-protein phosphatase [Candidatus Babeliales bacterium]|jgi:protein tyrosine phosphatase (PTP) superfamily phosphohydrolase (DUF442 family)